MIGIDIVKIDRIKKMYEKFGQKAYGKFLSADEIKLIKRVEGAAGFWAAKEAASKAIGTGIGATCGFMDIKITKTKSGSPQLEYSKKLQEQFSIKSSHLSITHDSGLAVAVVVLVYKD